MKKLKPPPAVDVFYFVGGALVSLGAGVLCLAAGLIVAGAFCLAASFLADRPAEGKGGEDGT